MTPQEVATKDDEENIAIVDAHRTFLATLLSAVAFIAVVITFIL